MDTLSAYRSMIPKFWKKNKKVAPRPGDPMVNQAQMAASQRTPAGRTIPQMGAMPAPVDRFNSQMGPMPGTRPGVSPQIIAGPPAPPLPIAGADAPAGMPPGLLNQPINGNPWGTTGEVFLGDVSAPQSSLYPQAVPLTPASPSPVPVPASPASPANGALAGPDPNAPPVDYQGMIARLANRAQNRAALYSQVMNPAIANLPPELKQVYQASIPDVQTNLNAYTDALAGSATMAPQLDIIMAQQDAALKAQQQGTGGAGGFDAVLASMIAEQQNKKK